MKIGLLHFPFADSNLGCVALTCAMITILKEVCGTDVEIMRLASAITDEVITKDFPDIKFSSGKIAVKDLKGQTVRNFKKCDCVMDVTFGDNFADIYNKKFVLKTTIFKELVLLSGTPLLLMPQTYGPFSDRMLQRFAGYVIEKSERVYSRDQLSTDYVKKISGVNAVTVTDLAFALPYEKKRMEETHRKRIGIGISGLLWRQKFNGASPKFSVLKTDYRAYIQKLIESLLSKGSYEIHLIPHVIHTKDNAVDGDWDECVQLHKLYPETILADKFATPVEAKSYIAAMDIFTGARMHSTIAAFSSGVATIPFAYSRKFQGLYEGIGYSYYVDGAKLTTEGAAEQTLKYILMSDELAVAQENSMQIVNDKLAVFKKDLSSTLKRLENEKR